MIEYFADNQNCLQCCIAGMFDLALNAVPTVKDFEVDSKQRFTGNWFDSFYDWSKEYVAHVPVVFAEDQLDDTLDDIIHIAVTKTEKGVIHSRIYKGEDIIWDPTYKATDKQEPLYRIIFVPLNCPGGVNHEWQS